MKARCFILALIPILLIPATAPAQNSGDGNLHIYCIAVGLRSGCGISHQGDSTLIVSPTGKRMLIDAGSGGKCGADTVTATLQRVIPTGGMNYMVTTHWDSDHSDGMDDVALYNQQQYMPQTIYDLGDDGGGTSYNTVFSGRRATPSVGDTINLGGGATAVFVTVDGHIYGGDYRSPGSDKNARSIGVLIRYGGFDYLTLGDLPSAWENDLADALEATDFNIDIHHVSHHGSKNSTSNTFCSDIRPEFAVISCGDNNGYGHPNQDAINHLNALTIGGSPYNPPYPSVTTIYLLERGDWDAGWADNCKIVCNGSTDPAQQGSLKITARGGGCEYLFANEGPNTNGLSDGPYPSDNGAPCGPSPGESTTWPVELRTNKARFSRTDNISINADFKVCLTPFHPYIRLRDPNGRYLYILRTYPKQQTRYSWGSPIPFRTGGPFVLDFELDYYPILDTYFLGAIPGIWYLEGGFSDVYGNIVGGVNRNTLIVQ